MHRKNMIVLLTPNKAPVVRGNFKKLCKEFGFPYWTLVRLKFPIKYKESVIHKVEFK